MKFSTALLEKFASKCPTCGSEAYIGLNVVECSNPECRNYNTNQKQDSSLCPGCGESFDLDMKHEDECPWEKAFDYAIVNIYSNSSDASRWADAVWRKFK